MRVKKKVPSRLVRQVLERKYFRTLSLATESSRAQQETVVRFSERHHSLRPSSGQYACHSFSKSSPSAMVRYSHFDYKSIDQCACSDCFSGTLSSLQDEGCPDNKTYLFRLWLWLRREQRSLQLTLLFSIWRNQPLEPSDPHTRTFESLKSCQ